MANVNPNSTWVNIDKKTITVTGNGNSATMTFYLDAKCTGQSITNNTSTVYTRLRSTKDSGSASGSGYGFTCTYCDSKSGSQVWNYVTETILSSSAKTINHSGNGSKTISLSATATNSYLGIDVSLSGNAVLKTIDRYATITSATNFTDIENPVLKYSNPAGNNVSSLQACLSLTGASADIAYRDISKTGSSYTFNLTESERNVLRSAAVKNTLNVIYYVKTVIGGNTHYETATRTMTIVNANPTETTSFLETNSAVSNLLGSTSAYTIIQNVSNVKMTSSPTSYKYASVSKVLFKNGSSESTDNTSPYETTITPTTNTFTTTVTDSRGNTVSNNYTKNMIGYLPVSINSCTFKRQNATSSNIVLNADIRYFQTTFNGNVNSPTIKWKMGENGTLNTLTSSDYSIDTTNNTITIYNLVLSSLLPYTTPNTFYLYVNDLLTSVSDRDDVPRGIPTFEAGEHDFQVNGQFYVADENRTNIKEIRDLIYPVGSIYMSVNSTNPYYLFGGTWEAIQGRFLIGTGANVANTSNYWGSLAANALNCPAGEMGGETVHTLVTSEMPSHTHTISSSGGHSHTAKFKEHPLASSSNSKDFARKQSTSDQDSTARVTVSDGAHTHSPAKTGGDGSHNNMPPYLSVYMWKRTS